MYTTLLATALVLVPGALLAASEPQDGVCLQPFSAVDSDGDGGLTMDETPGLARAEFEAMDGDADGHLTPAEFDDCVGAIHGESHSERQVIDRRTD